MRTDAGVPVRGMVALLVGLGMSSLALAEEQIAGPQKTLPQTPLVIQTAKGRATLNVELATEWPQQEVGLMFRKSVAPNGGMLFDFKQEALQSFWMKNTLVPLDMLFIKADGTIVRIASNTTPLSEAPVPSYEPVRAVLEIAGGRAAALGIEPGDKAIHRMFGNAGK